MHNRPYIPRHPAVHALTARLYPSRRTHETYWTCMEGTEMPALKQRNILKVEEEGAIQRYRGIEV
jgi:hypothetical protein